MTREDAINEIKSWAIPSKKGREVLETLIPELRESKDERARKAALEGIEYLERKLGWDAIGDTDILDVKEYLEKQKENNEYVFRPLAGTDITIAAEQAIRRAMEGDNLVLAFNGVYLPVRKYNSAKELVDEYYAYLEKQKEQKPVMIQWTGKNLKEVIDFTSKSPRFDEWFKSWEEFEDYVHSHDDILKLFCEDGSHYEVPVGAWIVKTPDGYNIPSRFRFIQKPAEWSEEDEKMLKVVQDLIYGIELSAQTEFGYKQAVACLEWLNSLRPHPQGTYKQVVHTIFGMLKDKDLYEIQPSHRISLLNDIRVKCKDAIECAPILDQPSWKPSEQEKSALRTAIYVLTDERNFPKTAAQLQNILNAFEGKESRKDWKPSEEQSGLCNN